MTKRYHHPSEILDSNLLDKGFDSLGGTLTFRQIQDPQRVLYESTGVGDPHAVSSLSAKKAWKNPNRKRRSRNAHSR